jgi:hypothetical protein
VVTTHAASVQETLLRILSSQNAKSPADRRKCAGVIRMIVHLRRTSTIEGVKLTHFVPESERDKKRRDLQKTQQTKAKTILPTIWIGNGSALNSLVYPGISSVVPNGRDCLSNTHYIDFLLDAFSRESEMRKHLTQHSDDEEIAKHIVERIEANRDKIRLAAQTLDIEDLNS